MCTEWGERMVLSKLWINVCWTWFVQEYNPYLKWKKATLQLPSLLLFFFSTSSWKYYCCFSLNTDLALPNLTVK